MRIRNWAASFVTSCLCLTLSTLVASQETSHEEAVRGFFGEHSGTTSSHTNNWAVLVCASRYWFNYRHMSNALGMYRTVKRLGIPDSNIILMLADDTACNARNKFPGCVYSNAGRSLDLYGDNIEVDYRGYEVTVENFIRVLTGRMDSSVPRSKRLLTDDRSNIFVYMTGHGGNEFLKFQDNEEISAFDIADAFEQMWQKKRYNEILFMIDTCQANGMYTKFYSPNILATGSSRVGENSYSYENDRDIGVAVIDSFTHHILQFMEGIDKTSQKSMQDLFDIFDPVKIHSHPGIRSDLFHRPLSQTLVTDFFGGVAQAEVLAPVGPASNTSMSASVDSQVSISQHASEHLNSAQFPTSLKSHDEELLTLLDSPLPRGAQPGTLARTARAWGSVALVGALVGWVGVRTLKS